MTIEATAGNIGGMAWKGFNTLLGAAGTAMGATALGSKTSEDKVREIIREEAGCGNGCYPAYGMNRCNPFVSRFELEQQQQIANLTAKDYSNQSDLSLFADYTARINAEKERVNGRFETIFGELVASRERLQAEVCRLDKEAALNKQAMEFGFANVNKEFACVNSRLDAITKEVVPLSAICPQPLPACVPVTFTGQVINTDDTSSSTTVVGARAVKNGG